MAKTPHFIQLLNFILKINLNGFIRGVNVLERLRVTDGHAGRLTPAEVTL
jgi:hypothetical protein